MICKDNLPLSCTEKEGMKHFLKTSVPLYKVPGRKKVYEHEWSFVLIFIYIFDIYCRLLHLLNKSIHHLEQLLEKLYQNVSD